MLAFKPKDSFEIFTRVRRTHPVAIPPVISAGTQSPMGRASSLNWSSVCIPDWWVCFLALHNLVDSWFSWQLLIKSLYLTGAPREIYARETFTSHENEQKSPRIRRGSWISVSHNKSAAVDFYFVAVDSAFNWVPLVACASFACQSPCTWPWKWRLRTLKLLTATWVVWGERRSWRNLSIAEFALGPTNFSWWKSPA